MTDKNYDKIVERISKTSGLDISEIERRVEAKISRLSGLITKEGAAQVVASELGISFEKEKLKIEELLSGMRNANVIGKIINKPIVRNYVNRKGEESKVANFVVADDTSNIKVVLWDTNHISLLENEDLKEGSVIEIKNGSVRDNEIHLGSFSELKISNEDFSRVITERVIREKKIFDFRVSDVARTRAFIVQTFEPRFFHVCSECGKKVVSGAEGFVCSEHGKVASEKKALINFVIDDGTESIRAVAFSNTLNGLGITALDDPDELISQRSSLLGKEMVFIGNVRTNKFFNNLELILDEVKEVDVDEVIERLEKEKV